MSQAVPIGRGYAILIEADRKRVHFALTTSKHPIFSIPISLTVLGVVATDALRVALRHSRFR